MTPVIAAVMAVGSVTTSAAAPFDSAQGQQPFDSAQGQQPFDSAQGQRKEAEPAAEQVVRQWFERWNAIGSGPEAIDQIVALYEPDALHITGPSPDQRGTATYRGHEGLRVLLNRLASTRERMTYRIETDTAREETTQLMHATNGPWGGPAVSVQMVAAYTDKGSKKRYAVPGAAFFQFANGKIHRARIYYAEGERAEVEPEPTRRRP